MNKRKSLKSRLNTKMFMAFLFVLFILFLLFIILQNRVSYNENIKLHNANALDIINQRMTSLIFEINNFPRTASDEILFLSGLSSLHDLVNNGNSFIDNLENDFFNFVEGGIAYYQIRYINSEGNEVVRVDFDGEEVFIVPKNELQNKNQRDYFNKTSQLEDGEVLVSKLDLNIEGEKIENRGTEEHPIYVPVIRYSTPIFDDTDDFEGIVVSNIYADYFLEDVRRFSKESEIFYLIDNFGNYLSHPNRTKEFSHMFKGEYNFNKDYPLASKHILESGEGRWIELGEFIFTYRYIFPSLGSFEMYSGTEKMLSEESEEDYFWVLVSVSDKSEMLKTVDNIRQRQFKNNLTIFLFGMIFILIIYFIIFMSGKKKFRNVHGK